MSFFDPLWVDRRVQALNQALDAFQGAEAYVVGGAVRDAFLQKPFPFEDVDVCVLHVSAEELARHLVAHTEDTRLVVLDEAWGIFRVVFFSEAPEASPLFLDIAQALGDEIEQDLARRDLSINAMALHTRTRACLDPYHGQADLEQGRITALSFQNMKEDPLRVLRLFRFHAVLNQQKRPSILDSDSLAWALDVLPFLTQVAKERVAVEWFKLLSAPHAFSTLALMAETGVLEVLFPALRVLKCVSPNSHHHLPLWEHSLALVQEAEGLWPDLDVDTQQALLAPTSHSATEYSVLKMACLFHDLAKPQCWQIERLPNGARRHRFLGHEKMGANLLLPILKSWHLSQQVQKRLTHLVAWHLYPCTFSPASSEKSRLRYFRKMGEHTPFLGVLALADTLSTRGPALTSEAIAQAKQHQLQLLQQYWDGLAQRQAPPCLDGHRLMSLLHLAPGPQVGKILSALQDAQALGEVNTVEEAVAWAVAYHQSI